MYVVNVDIDRRDREHTSTGTPFHKHKRVHTYFVGKYMDDIKR